MQKPRKAESNAPVLEYLAGAAGEPLSIGPQCVVAVSVIEERGSQTLRARLVGGTGAP